MNLMLERPIALLVLFSLATSAAVTRVQLRERSDVLEGAPFGSSGSYERIIGKVFFTVDPELPGNRIISDIDLAPRNERGQVEFSADLYVLKPRDPARGNGTVLFEVPNRGGKGLLGMFCNAVSTRDPRSEKDFGDGFLLTRGFTLVWLGWQFDVPKEPGLMRLYAPVAHHQDRPITGVVRAEYIPTSRVLSFSLGDRTMIPYPVADRANATNRLTVRDNVLGRRRTIPRRDWQFARAQNGKPVPDCTQVFMSSGFVPGKIYEVTYKAQDPVVAGLGLAAVRDFISFLKYGIPGGSRTLLGDQRRYLRRAIGFGSSQSGRFLRTFIYLGFNADEEGRKVFDGVWAHVAGAGRGSFNHRFAQPSRDGHPFMNTLYPTDIFPFTDLDQTDQLTALTDGILHRSAAAGVVPKIFYTNGSYEYWGRAASLIHTSLDGKKDVPLSPMTRIYFFSGSQHGPAPFPPQRTATQNLPNFTDFRWCMRALLVRLNRWITDGTAPPVSRYPRVASGELVLLQQVRFPKIPSVRFPIRLHLAYRVNYGPEFRTKGVITIEPPKVGKPFTVLVPQVDADGNETSGIRMPEVKVPLGTFTGWNLRAHKIGAPDELYSMVGSFIPFPRTKAERIRTGDPRRSIEERYAGRKDYLTRVSAAAYNLVKTGYLLQDDQPELIKRAGVHWDVIIGGKLR